MLPIPDLEPSGGQGAVVLLTAGDVTEVVGNTLACVTTSVLVIELVELLVVRGAVEGGVTLALWLALLVSAICLAFFFLEMFLVETVLTDDEVLARTIVSAGLEPGD
jgi:hypothetical protein